MPESFSSKLESSFAQFSQLCIGIDPHAELLTENGFDDNVQSLHTYVFKMLDQLTGVIGIIKPQVSFFERFGSKGFQVLEVLLSEAANRNLLVVVDVKRGDIGSTMQAYTDAWLAKDAPFMCDAITLSPYLGVSSLSSAMSIAAERGKGIFVLAATSNPEAKELQLAKQGERTVARIVADEVAELNSAMATSRGKFGNLGLVIGATIDLNEYGLQNLNQGDRLRSPILAPGFGFQGARLQDATSLFGDLAGDVIYTISRSALRNGLQAVGLTVQADIAELDKGLGR